MDLHDQMLRDIANDKPATFVSALSAIQRETTNMLDMATSVISHAQVSRLAPGVYHEAALEAVVSYTKELAKAQN